MNRDLASLYLSCRCDDHVSMEIIRHCFYAILSWIEKRFILKWRNRDEIFGIWIEFEYEFSHTQTQSSVMDLSGPFKPRDMQILSLSMQLDHDSQVLSLQLVVPLQVIIITIIICNCNVIIAWSGRHLLLPTETCLVSLLWRCQLVWSWCCCCYCCCCCCCWRIAAIA